MSADPQERWADPEAELWSPAGGERAKGGAPGGPAEGGAPGAASCEGPDGSAAGGGRAKRFLPFSAGARDCAPQEEPHAPMGATRTLIVIDQLMEPLLAARVPSDVANARGHALRSPHASAASGSRKHAAPGNRHC